MKFKSTKWKIEFILCFLLCVKYATNKNATHLYMLIKKKLMVNKNENKQSAGLYSEE